MDACGLWSHAGAAANIGSSGVWYAALEEAALPDDPESRALLRADWREPYGDRRQELVFIGVDLDEAALRRQLDGALLTAAELTHGPTRWVELHDPFPSWAEDDP
jgi:hypothetical protein